MIDLVSIIESIQKNPFYLVILVFFAWYPIFTSAVWIATAIGFYLRRERRRPMLWDKKYLPSVTVLIAAYNEEEHIEATIEGALAINYPDFEVVIVNDGSTDGTLDKIKPYVKQGRVRVIHKQMNEGKAMALNDAIPRTRGEIILIIDADAIPDRQILRTMVPHFQSPRVGAVTGNPRVANRSSLLAKLQALEFTSIVSLQRRGSRIWGKMLTMSGVVGAFDRNVLLDVGLFAPEMATEDIDLTWKIQLKFYEIRYEPHAIVWMRVPTTARGLWRQRKRWALGLSQVIRRHTKATCVWRARRMWPVLAECALSILWSFTFVGLTILWTISYAAGYPPVGASPIPNYWGMLIGTMCLLQLLVGVILDRRYDRRLPWYYSLAIFYPLVYWIFMAIVTVISTPMGFRGPEKGRLPVKWKPIREAV